MRMLSEYFIAVCLEPKLCQTYLKSGTGTRIWQVGQLGKTACCSLAFT
ncbi:hypothetical protein fHeYen902_342c [Yersinia phage fHe-Yen9-02]|nr:hypothetical protein fHeYen902_342c [Yersinia phage fHe-Yen9-02]